ncbi:MAG: hypothetical protein ACI8QT_001004 [Halioglobus sp.]|jgi:hypothetical protein
MRAIYTLKRIMTLLLLTLALCGTVQVIWAQDAAVEATQPKTNTKESDVPNTATTEKITPTPASNDSPFDYEASEEISQDLSVSFPVDI